MIQGSVKNFSPRIPTFFEVLPSNSLASTKGVSYPAEGMLSDELISMESILESQELVQGKLAIYQKNTVVRGDFS